VEHDISKEVETISNICNKYQEVIVKAHLKNRRNNIRKTKKAVKERLETKLSEEHDERVHNFVSEQKSQNLDEEEVISDWLLERWSFELANRRQYLAFLKSIQEEVNACSGKITDLCDTIREELNSLSSLVGGQASVAKEVVYPRFDSLASTWITLWEEYNLLKVRNNTFVSLRKFKSSFTCSLTEKVYVNLVSMVNAGVDISLAAGNHGLYDDDIDDDVDIFAADEKRSGGTAKLQSNYEQKKRDEKSSAQNKETKRVLNDSYSVELDDYSPQGAALLQAHNTPDFMLLPLELQGFCPWTMVHASALLVPGKPALGVIRYDNMYYVCEHKLAIKAFMNDPEGHLRRIKEICQRNPEFIHLLRLQNYFPTASIARLVDKPEFDKSDTTKKSTREAGTETPTHFVEKFIDPNYHWNEWELRRRVLKVVNLKNCSTVGSQTDQSHYRRDGETQVYLPKVKGTQTRRDKGTNPVMRTTYIAGLRGSLPADSKDVSRYVTPDDLKSDARNKARVVTLTLER
jgi:hypothetical protein